MYAAYGPALAKLGRALRAKLRARLPGLSEVVYRYETIDALVIAYSPTGKGGGSDAVCAITLQPRGAQLSFTRGAELAQTDPHKLLQGKGKTVRHVALARATDLERPEIEALLAAALKLARSRPDPQRAGALVFKIDEQQRRARKPRRRA